MQIDFNNIEFADQSKQYCFSGGSVMGHQLTPKIAELMIRKGFDTRVFQRQRPIWVTVDRKTGRVNGVFEKPVQMFAHKMVVGDQVFNDKFSSNTEKYPWKEWETPPIGCLFHEFAGQFRRFKGERHRNDGNFTVNFGLEMLPEEGKQVKNLKFYQVYFNTRSERNLEDSWTPYHNRICSKYFENDVIIDVHSRLKHEWQNRDYVGVFSHAFFQKTGLHWYDVTRRLAERQFKSDVYCFWSQPKHNPIIHGQTQHPALAEIAEIILVNKLGWEKSILTRPVTAFYLNFWAAKPEIFDDYVTNFLKPVRKIMEDKGDARLQRLLNSNAMYFKARTMPKNWLLKTFGQNYYTHHTFFLERMPCLWFDRKGIGVQLIH